MNNFFRTVVREAGEGRAPMKKASPKPACVWMMVTKNPAIAVALC